MNEEKALQLLTKLGIENASELLTEDSAADLDNVANEITSSWKKAGQADEQHLKDVQSKAYGKIHGGYKNMVKKLTGKTDADVKELDKDGLEALLSDHLRGLTEGNPDKAAIQEMQAKLAEFTEQNEGLAAKLSAKEQALLDLEPTLTAKLTNKFNTERALSKAFNSVENFPFEADEAMRAFIPKLGKHNLEVKDGILRAVNTDTGELLYKDNKAVDVAEMARNWALEKAPKQKEQTEQKPYTESEGVGNKYIHPKAAKMLAERQAAAKA